MVGFQKDTATTGKLIQAEVSDKEDFIEGLDNEFDNFTDEELDALFAAFEKGELNEEGFPVVQTQAPDALAGTPVH